jgi:hypothetical protein
MKAIDYILSELKRKDTNLGSYLTKFYKENEHLDETAFAEKLSKDPLYLLFINDATLGYNKKTAIWVKFIGVVILLSIIITFIYAIFSFK